MPETAYSENEGIPEHWDYFLTLEEDVQALSRWIAFSKSNENVYSIELARLLMTACAEIDVIAKSVCARMESSRPPDGINGYRAVLMRDAGLISKAVVRMPRYGIELAPWRDWGSGESPPTWWQAHNKVKHHRSEHFNQATLKNVWNSVGGLLVLLHLYYAYDRVHIGPVPKLFVADTFSVRKGSALRLFAPDGVNLGKREGA